VLLQFAAAAASGRAATRSQNRALTRSGANGTRTRNPLLAKIGTDRARCRITPSHEGQSRSQSTIFGHPFPHQSPIDLILLPSSRRFAWPVVEGLVRSNGAG
jgi:hypothetical protein